MQTDGSAANMAAPIRLTDAEAVDEDLLLVGMDDVVEEGLNSFP